MSRLSTFYSKLKHYDYTCFPVRMISGSKKTLALSKIDTYSKSICFNLDCEQCPWYSTTQKELKNVFEPMA